MLVRVLLAALIASSFAAASHAAVFTALSGEASVNRGAGFKLLDVGAQLQTGDRVLVSQGRTVTILLSPDCEITVFPEETYSIPEVPRCNAATDQEVGPTQPATLSYQSVALGVAGVGLATGVIIVAAQSGGGDDALPVSP